MQIRTIFSKAIIFSALWCLSLVTIGQEYVLFSDQKEETPQDLVLVYGQLLDASSKQPVKGHINYEKMPNY